MTSHNLDTKITFRMLISAITGYKKYWK